jgi:hypothetical protein
MTVLMYIVAVVINEYLHGIFLESTGTIRSGYRKNKAKRMPATPRPI